MTDKALTPVRAGQGEITVPGPDDPYRDFLVGQLSPRTRRIYQSDLLCFFVWLEDPEALEDPQTLREAKTHCRPGPADIARVTTDQVIAYRNYLFDLGRSPSTVARHLSVLRQFFDLAEERGLVPANPTRSRRVRSPKVNPYGKAQYLTREQAEALLKRPDRTTVKGRRDHAILLLFLHNALRRSEVVSLRWGDLGTVGGYQVAYVLRKGKQEREPVKLKPQVWQAILDYVEASGRTMTPEAPLFVATTDAGDYLRRYYGNVPAEGETPLSAEAIRQMVKRYAGELGLDIAPHALRHTSGRLARRGGADVEKVREFLGHAQLNTTQIYLQQVASLDDHGTDYVHLEG